MKSKEHLRPIEVIAAPSIGTKPGYFHRWCVEPFINDPGMTKTFALVELMDGRVKFIEPEFLRFTEPYQPKN